MFSSNYWYLIVEAEVVILVFFVMSISLVVHHGVIVMCSTHIGQLIGRLFGKFDFLVNVDMVKASLCGWIGIDGVIWA